MFKNRKRNLASDCLSILLSAGKEIENQRLGEYFIDVLVNIGRYFIKW